MVLWQSALLITFKLSNIIFAFGIGLIAIFWINKYPFNTTEKKILINTSISIFLLFSIWILRGYIQTGYPLFPSSFGRINFFWTVPVEIAKIERECIYAGSRSCERTFNINSPLLKNYAWLDRWIEKYFLDKRIFSDKSFSENICIVLLLLLFPFTLNNYGIASVSLFVITLILLGIWLKSSIINKTISNKEIVLIGLIITGFSSLIFCFSTAPCPRFVNGIFIINFITSLLLLKTVYVQLKINTKIKNSLLFYFLFVFVLYFCCAYYDDEFAINGIFVLKKAEMKEYTTKYGLKVLTPVNGAIEIWDSALPATPNKNSLLSLLGNNISEGFCIKGNIKITVKR